jgi:hypothetical protein
LETTVKHFAKKSAAAISALVTGLCPMAGEMSVATAARTAAVVTVSAAALVPMSAQAQTNHRMCARIFNNAGNNGRGWKIAVGMEVNKLDYVTCTALQATWLIISTLPNSFKSFLASSTAQAIGAGHQLQGSPVYMATCESFSKKMNANTGDVCLRMTDYKLYGFAWDGRFTMGNISL